MRLRVAAFVVPALIISGLAVQSALDVRAARTQTLRQAERQAQNLARVLEEHAARIVGEADATLQSVDHIISVTRTPEGGFDTAAVASAIRGKATIDGPISAIVVLDREGIPVQWEIGGGSRHSPWPSGDRDYYLFHRDATGTKLHVGVPVKSRITGRWIIPVSRALLDPNGAFAGVVYATLLPTYFAEFYRSLDIGTGGIVSLLRTDGVVMVREPFDEAQLGLDLSSTEIFRNRQQRPPVGVLEYRSPLDGKSRSHAYRRLEGLPLLVAVGFDPEEVLAPWREYLKQQVLIGILATALTLWLAALAIRQFDRLRHATNLLVRREAEAAAGQSYFGTLLEGAHDVITVVNTEGIIEYESPAVSRVFGWRPDELVGRHASHGMHPDDLPQMLETFKDLIVAPGRSAALAFRFCHRDGGYRYIDCSARSTTAPDGRLVVVTNSRDITERYEQRARIEDIRKRYDAALIAAEIGLWEWDIAGGDGMLSHACDRILGDPCIVGAISMERWSELIHPEDRVSWNETVRAALAGKGVLEGVLRLRHADGTWRWVAARGEAQRDESGRATKVSGVLYDVTETQEQWHATMEAKEAAEAANQAKSMFLANMSHELRTPLNAVIGFGELLETGLYGPLNVKQRDYVQDILDSGRLLLGIIGDILDMSKIEAGRYELHEIDVCVADLVTECQRLMMPRATAAGVTLLTLTPHDIPLLHADRQSAKQVLLNLLSNAVKFSKAGDSVTLSVTLSVEGLAIAVADTGIGITPEHLPLVFEPFHPTNASVSRGHEGAGLGLAISQRLMNLHGGSIDLVSELGRGTTATARFPKRRLYQERAVA